MSYFTRRMLGSGVVLICCSCQQTGDMPLVFGQSNTLGLTIGASTTEQSGEITLGYKGRNIAIVPLVTKQADGQMTLVTATVPSEHGSAEDAMSTFGQFESDARAAPGQTSLGTFFATGMAARYLAQGFEDKLGAAKPTAPPAPPAPPAP